MARYIEKRLYSENKRNHADKKYILHHYMLDDGMEVTSLQEFNEGDRVECWFDDNWGIPKIKLYGS